MLDEVFIKLNDWIAQENLERSNSSVSRLLPFTIKILGQVALIEAKVDLNLFATKDIDAYHNADYIIIKKFEDLLLEKGFYLDLLSESIWMPSETQYQLIFESNNFKAYIAEPIYVLISKALKAPEKNKSLIIEYLSKNPSKLFLDLASKYNIDLEGFLK